MGNAAMSRIGGAALVRATFAVALVLVLAGTSIAAQSASPANPIIGTWKLNPALTKTMRKTVSSDGTSMRQVVAGVSAAGAPFDGVLVFDRQ